jgi:hypothetical protein
VYGQLRVRILAGEDTGQYFTRKLSSTCWAGRLILTRKLDASVEGEKRYITITTGNNRPGAMYV